MISVIWHRLLPRGLAVIAALIFIVVVVLAPFLVWTLLFKLWNGWAVHAGWHVIIPLNWKSVVTAVVICWLIRWLVCHNGILKGD